MKDEEIIESNKKVEESLKVMEEKWDKTIEDLSKRLSCEAKELVELQSEVISRRQILTDEIAQMSYNIYKLLPKIKRIRKERFEFYSLEYQIRKISGPERAKLIDADLSFHDHLINIYEAHIEFLRETCKNVDNINYAIKNKIELYNIMGSID